MKTLIVVDMQNDFIDGALGTKEAQAIVPNVKKKIDEYVKRGDHIIFTQDTHFDDYLDSQEGKLLPVKHCIYGTHGWEVARAIDIHTRQHIPKHQFGYTGAGWYNALGCYDSEDMTKPYRSDEIEIVGLCTDICVVSNALILKSILPEMKITVDASCCAGVTPKTHKAALTTMKMCQINVIGE